MNRTQHSNRTEALRGAPSQSDAELLARARRCLLEEALLGACAIWPDGWGVLPRAPALFPEGSNGYIRVRVEDGVIYLQGEVQDLADRQLAATVVRRLPGCRQVVNQLRCG